MALAIRELPSPNFGLRQVIDGSAGVRHLVAHYTGMKSCQEALDRLCDAKAEVSAHYVVDEVGAVYRLVAEDKRAWHAGASFWRGVHDINSTSVGVEIVNPGHDYGYRPFPALQIEAFITLARGIMTRHGIAAGDVLGHSDVAPGRKTDPGELFPWPELASHGIGLWPEDTVTVTGHPDMNRALRRLSEIGYAVPMTPELGSDILRPESAVTDVIAAFQSRYRQDRVDGLLDSATAARIAAVAVRFASARANT
ncbi:MAG: N-acetylmuramoyl-L-alanine amidase [Rhodospirillaceae bacterium]|nr:N-acetylmuramoyl-L-alanine amidase [Rhodospirillaceae bacterium]